MSEINRQYISPTYNNDVVSSRKIKAADGVIGTIIMLAYWGNGKNLFHTSIKVSDYIQHKNMAENYLLITIDNLARLIRDISKAISVEIGALKVNSLSVYRTALRKGKRANNTDDLPPINTDFNGEDQVMKIHFRNYKEDQEVGLVSTQAVREIFRQMRANQ